MGQNPFEKFYPKGSAFMGAVAGSGVTPAPARRRKSLKEVEFKLDRQDAENPFARFLPTALPAASPGAFPGLPAPVTAKGLLTPRKRNLAREFPEDTPEQEANARMYRAALSVAENQGVKPPARPTNQFEMQEVLDFVQRGQGNSPGLGLSDEAQLERIRNAGPAHNAFQRLGDPMAGKSIDEAQADMTEKFKRLIPGEDTLIGGMLTSLGIGRDSIAGEMVAGWIPSIMAEFAVLGSDDRTFGQKVGAGINIALNTFVGPEIVLGKALSRLSKVAHSLGKADASKFLHGLSEPLQTFLKSQKVDDAAGRKMGRELLGASAGKAPVKRTGNIIDNWSTGSASETVDIVRGVKTPTGSLKDAMVELGWEKPRIDGVLAQVHPVLSQNPGLLWSVVDQIDPTGKLKQAITHQTSTPQFKEWFGNSRIVEPDGTPKVYYSGHGNVDLFGAKFDKRKATSGAFYATSDPDVASSYALSKWGNRETYENGSQYKIVPDKGRAQSIWDVRLTPDQRAHFDEWFSERYGDNIDSYLKENAPYDREWRTLIARGGGNNLGTWWKFMEYMGDNIAYPKQGDAPVFARQVKNDFEELMDSASIRYQDETWNQPGVLPMFVSVKNPLVVGDQFPPDLLAELKAAGGRVKPDAGDTQWTKEYPLANWVKDIEDGSEFWATQVPAKAVTILRKHGYDGILDKGGKLTGHDHDVVVFFDPTQAKSAIGNRGTFDATKPDMRFQGADEASGVKGSYNPRTRVAELVRKKADVSTVIHEVAHDWHQFLLGTQHSATILRRYGDLSDVAGAEKFARDFERYIAKGQAADGRMETVFAAFKGWMADIYHGSLGEGLSDDVRAIFDDAYVNPSDETLDLIKQFEAHGVAGKVADDGESKPYSIEDDLTPVDSSLEDEIRGAVQASGSRTPEQIAADKESQRLVDAQRMADERGVTTDATATQDFQATIDKLQAEKDAAAAAQGAPASAGSQGDRLKRAAALLADPAPDSEVIDPLSDVYDQELDHAIQRVFGVAEPKDGGAVDIIRDRYEQAANRLGQSASSPEAAKRIKEIRSELQEALKTSGPGSSPFFRWYRSKGIWRPDLRGAMRGGRGKSVTLPDGTVQRTRGVKRRVGEGAADMVRLGELTPETQAAVLDYVDRVGSSTEARYVSADQHRNLLATTKKSGVATIDSVSGARSLEELVYKEGVITDDSVVPAALVRKMISDEYGVLSAREAALARAELGKVFKDADAERIINELFDGPTSVKREPGGAGSIASKNAVTADMRSRYGLSELEQAERRTFAETLANPAGEFETRANVQAILDKKKRSITDTEQAGILKLLDDADVKYQALMDELAGGVDDARRAEIHALSSQLREDVSSTTEALKMIGSETARTLAQRRNLLDPSASLPRYLAEAESVAGRPLTAKETARETAEFTALKKQLVEAERKLALKEQQVAEVRAAEAVMVMRKSGGKRTTEVVRAALQSANHELAKALGKATDPPVKLYQGADASNPLGSPEVWRAFHKVLRLEVEGGATKLDDLVATMKGRFSEFGVELSEADVRRAIGGVGGPKSQPKTVSEATARLNELRKEARDLARGVVPAKIKERAAKASAASALDKSAARLDNAADQVRARVERYKAQLKKDIADLERQLNSGEVAVREKAARAYDTETTRLRRDRDAVKAKLKARLENMVPRPLARKVTDVVTEGKLLNPVARLWDAGSGGATMLDQLTVSGFTQAGMSHVMNAIKGSAGPDSIKGLPLLKAKRIIARVKADPVWKVWAAEDKFATRGPGSRIAGMTDVPPRAFLYHNTLDDLAFSQARFELGKGATRSQVTRRAEELVNDPLPEMVETALAEALSGTFNSASSVADGLKGMKQMLGRRAGGSLMVAGIDTLTRFTNVLANVAKDRAARSGGLYTTGGAVGYAVVKRFTKEGLSQADARAAAALAGKGLSGAAGVYLGYNVLSQVLGAKVTFPTKEDGVTAEGKPFIEFEGLPAALEQIGGFFSPSLYGASMRVIDDLPVRPEGEHRTKDRVPTPYFNALSEKEKANLRYRVTIDLLFNMPLTSNAQIAMDLVGDDPNKGQKAAGRILAAQAPALLKLGAERVDAMASGRGVFGKAPDRDVTSKEDTATDRVLKPTMRNVPGLRGRLPEAKRRRLN